MVARPRTVPGFHPPGARSGRPVGQAGLANWSDAVSHCLNGRCAASATSWPSGRGTGQLLPDTPSTLAGGRILWPGSRLARGGRHRVEGSALGQGRPWSARSATAAPPWQTWSCASTRCPTAGCASARGSVCHRGAPGRPGRPGPPTGPPMRSPPGELCPCCQVGIVLSLHHYYAYSAKIPCRLAPARPARFLHVKGEENAKFHPPVRSAGMAPFPPRVIHRA
jgi:hypothetical protein